MKVFLRGAQVADPELTSALLLFRRAANVLARLEDAIIYNGQQGPSLGPTPHAEEKGDVATRRKSGETLAALPRIYNVLGGAAAPGLVDGGQADSVPVPAESNDANDRGRFGDGLVRAVSDAIGRLEARGHPGPFAVTLDQIFYNAVQTPNEGSLVLPQDRILPFLNGGSLLRSSTLPERTGVVVSLGGAPVDLVIATDVSVNFLQVTTDPMFVFRVFEKMALRIKEPEAVITLRPEESARAATKSARKTR